MPYHPSGVDIAARLALTVAAGFLIGWNREARGHAAGLRTTLLVCLAASVSSIQMNLLLTVSGKQPSSFAVMDLMRLPLGILTGVGFIGGGAILKRGSLVVGVTTASTLWMATVIGLCLGGGQLILGAVATVLTVIVLAGLKVLDQHMSKIKRGVLLVTLEQEAPFALTPEDLGGAELKLLEQFSDRRTGIRTNRYEVRHPGSEASLLARLELLQRRTGVAALRWSVTPD